MTSAPYLTNYLENLEKLPEELQRNFTLMRNLDSRQQELTHDIDKEADNHISYLKEGSKDKKNASMLSIQRKFDKVKEYGDDKVQLAIQTYELVDRQIRKLDINLARFETEIASKAIIAKENGEGEDKKTKDNETKKQSALRGKETIVKTSKKKPLKKVGAKITSTAPSKIPSVKIVDNPTKTTNSVAVEVAVETGSLAGAFVGAGVHHSSEVLDMPVDPNEPTYCLCNQVSFGEMIGCDNPDCSIEWFHFACVKLRTKPKGKWFCSNCLTDMKKK